MTYFDYMQTPIGIIKIGASERGVTHIIFTELADSVPLANHITDNTKQQLLDYFEGKRKQFDVPLDMQGTDFQKKVWAALAEIPFGESVSYSDLAVQINKPKAIRAVGTANGRNPVAIIVPCHRVIGRDKNLRGYAWGLDRKSWLLKHEGIGFFE